MDGENLNENCVAIVRMANYSDILTVASIVTLVLDYFHSVYRSIFFLNDYFYEYQLLKVSEWSSIISTLK